MIVSWSFLEYYLVLAKNVRGVRKTGEREQGGIIADVAATPPTPMFKRKSKPRAGDAAIFNTKQAKREEERKIEKK